MELPKPNSCSIDVTEGCNLACDYCFTHSKHKRRVLPLDLGKRILDWWIPRTMEPNDKQPMQISWWGGEPLLEWDLLVALTYYAKTVADRNGRKVIFGGTTNGVLYTPDRVEWSQKNACMFLVSLDGIKVAHDKHRQFPDGRGSWDKVVANVREALKIAPNLRVRASFGPDTMEYFYESMLFFFEDLGITDVAFSLVAEGEWTDKTYEVMQEQFTKAVHYTIQRMKDGKSLSMKHLNDEACFSATQPNVQNPCGAGNSYMGWSVDGFLYPCHRFNKHGQTTKQRAASKLIIARPKGDSFEWCNEEWRRQFVEFKNTPPERCKECEIYGFSTCNGGCYAMNFDFTGDLREGPEAACRYNKVQNKAAKLFRQLADEAGLKIRPSGWDGSDQPLQLPPCVCYNMCYLERTPDEIVHRDRRTDTTCLCYQTSYSGAMEPQYRVIAEVDDEQKILKQFLDLSRRILLTRDQKKTKEQKALEAEVLEKTVLMLK